MARFSVCVAVALALAGCASVPSNETIAQAECRVHLMDPAQPYGKNSNEDALDQQDAVSRLSILELKDPRFRGGLTRNGPVQEALRDCR